MAKEEGSLLTYIVLIALGVLVGYSVGGSNASGAPTYAGGSDLIECSDGIDNDGDGYIDRMDPGCITGKYFEQDDVYTAKKRIACSDGIDNDGDRKIDYPADPGCNSIYDTKE